MLFANLIKTINITSKRYAGRVVRQYKAWPNDWVPFHWNRPEFVPGYFRGGDLKDFGAPKTEHLLRDAIASKKLKELDPEHPLRLTYSIANGTRFDWIETQTKHFLNQRGIVHEVDLNNSREAKIIRLTFLIRSYVELIKRKGTDDDKSNYKRTICNSLILRRHRYLCELKGLHSDRYKKIIKELRIEPTPNPINVPFIRPYRKKQMRKITIEYCRDLKEKKVDEYMVSLEKEKEEFEREKQETLAWIKEQEKFLGITVD